MPTIDIDKEAADAAEVALRGFELEFPRGLIRQERKRLGELIAAACKATADVAIACSPLTREPIAAGDIVRLRSGGPLMTVGEVIDASPALKAMRADTGRVVGCYWHDDENRAAAGMFPEVALVLDRRQRPKEQP